MGLVGHWLTVLPEAALESILTRRLTPHAYSRCIDGDNQIWAYCLVGAAGSAKYGGVSCWPGVHASKRWWQDGGIHKEALDREPDCVEIRYDVMCHRWGTERANALVRNRVLSILAARRLAQEPVAV